MCPEIGTGGGGDCKAESSAGTRFLAEKPPAIRPCKPYYVNCDLPVAEEMVRDPALFYRNCPKPIDFVLARSRDEVDLIECKWDPDALDPAACRVFRSRYPKGRNYLVTPLEGPSHVRRFGGVEMTVCAPEGVAAPPTPRRA